MKAPRPPGFHKTRRTRNWTAYSHDPYETSEKLPEPSQCPDCGAVYAHARWQWLPAAPQAAHSQRCPACRRIHDGAPAGHVLLEGAFVDEHRAEILRLVQHHEAREKAEHPMQRIMKLEETPHAIRLTTTDVHLARGIGEAMQNAYKGSLAVDYAKDEDSVRVSWSR